MKTDVKSMVNPIFPCAISRRMLRPPVINFRIGYANPKSTMEIIKEVNQNRAE